MGICWVCSVQFSFCLCLVIKSQSSSEKQALSRVNYFLHFSWVFGGFPGGRTFSDNARKPQTNQEESATLLLQITCNKSFHQLGSSSRVQRVACDLHWAKKKLSFLELESCLGEKIKDKIFKTLQPEGIVLVSHFPGCLCSLALDLLKTDCSIILSHFNKFPLW